MREAVEEFISYMEKVRRASANTVISYRRDLRLLEAYLKEAGISDMGKVTQTSLNSYLLSLEREGRAASSISRMLAAVKAFFHYQFSMGKIRRDPAEFLKAPRVEKKPPRILSGEEARCLFDQPAGATPKEVRDKAMLELLHDTGLRVSELLDLKTEDVNWSVGYLCCGGNGRARMLPFGARPAQLLRSYVCGARPELLKGKASPWLFVNCSGKPMTRQGFWKIVKYYGAKAGLGDAVTPHSLGYSAKADGAAFQTEKSAKGGV